jgi:hypothetical protein
MRPKQSGVHVRQRIGLLFSELPLQHHMYVTNLQKTKLSPYFAPRQTSPEWLPLHAQARREETDLHKQLRVPQGRLGVRPHGVRVRRSLEQAQMCASMRVLDRLSLC